MKYLLLLAYTSVSLFKLIAPYIQLAVMLGQCLLAVLQRIGTSGVTRLLVTSWVPLRLYTIPGPLLPRLSIRPCLVPVCVSSSTASTIEDDRLICRTLWMDITCLKSTTQASRPHSASSQVARIAIKKIAWIWYI